MAGGSVLLAVIWNTISRGSMTAPGVPCAPWWAARSCASSASHGCETILDSPSSAPTPSRRISIARTPRGGFCAPARPPRGGGGFSARVGEALLHQSLVAGVGNVIRIEACFRARISPWRPIGELEPDEAVRLIAE